MKLEVKDLHKSFGGTEVLHGISFSVESGRALGLLGRNGAGKTTTIRILMQVFAANKGTVTLDGVPFSTKKIGIGYLPEERGLYPKKTVTEQLMYLAQLRGMKKAEAAKAVKHWLERMGVEQYASRKLETLSKGNQQKVQLAATLVHNPPVIILDEPFSGLDPVNSQVLKDVIQEQPEDLYDRRDGDDEHLVLVYAPVNPTGKGNDVNATEGWSVVADETSTKLASYPHISETNYEWTDNGATKNFAVTKDDLNYMKGNNATPLTEANYEGVPLRVYVWLEGTDADCISSVVDGDNRVFNVTLHLAGVTKTSASNTPSN